MIDRIEFIAATLCIALAAYTLIGEAIPLYIMLFLAVGIITATLTLTHWFDR
ncbi:MAG: hypothetical protein K8J31_20065 [Anaerolineae bacterium]|nr:hypothetical protein [Anaerolineae bacterium]